MTFKSFKGAGKGLGSRYRSRVKSIVVGFCKIWARAAQGLQSWEVRVQAEPWFFSFEVMIQYSHVLCKRASLLLYSLALVIIGFISKVVCTESEAFFFEAAKFVFKWGAFILFCKNFNQSSRNPLKLIMFYNPLVLLHRIPWHKLPFFTPRPLLDFSSCK